MNKSFLARVAAVMLIIIAAFALTACREDEWQPVFEGHVAGGEFVSTDTSWMLTTKYADGQIDKWVVWTMDNIMNRKIVHSHTSGIVRIYFLQQNVYGDWGAELIEPDYDFVRDWGNQSLEGGFTATILREGGLWIRVVFKNAADTQTAISW